VTSNIGPGIGKTEAVDVLEKQLDKEVSEHFWRFLKQWRVPLLLLLLIAICCEVALLTSLTHNEADLVHYQCYGLTFWLGSHGANLLPSASCAFLFPPPSQPVLPQPAFHMLPLEYPPLTILLFSLPLLAPLSAYALVFALLMTLTAGLVYWLLARSDARQAAPIFLLYLLLGAAGVFQERFDLLPAACTLVCILAAERGRWRVAYVALAAGVLLKFYPIVILPALFLAEQRAWLKEPGENVEQETRLSRAWTSIKGWHWSNCLLCAGLLIAVMGGFALLNVQDAIISPLHYFLTRPIQIESLDGSVLWLSDHSGSHSTIMFTFGSLNLYSGLASWISPVDTLLTVAGLLLVFWLQWRRRIDLMQAAVGLLCVLMTTGKVFSPQYLLWLIPLLAYAYARGRVSRAWMVGWAAISLLTTFIYIFYYSRLTDPSTDAQVVLTLPGFFELVALRNLFLLGATLAFLGNWWKVRSSRAEILAKQVRA
jgi:hypothetical protein